MLVAIHQPLYFPWLGYLDRMAKADLFVVLDHVQFERRNYQNRASILLEGQPRWLTVPVVQVSQKERIIEKQVDNSAEGSRQWGPNHFKTLKYAYRKAPHFERYARRLQDLLEARWESLLELDLATMEFMRDAFEIRTPMRLSSHMQVEGARSELLLNICKSVGPDSTFLGGMGGSRHYLDKDAFAAAGIGVQWQDFKHPIYAQCGDAPFQPGQTALDFLFNLGPFAAEYFHQAGHVERERLAA
ncbi:MAG TPA: WbqC family protein [Usitatibacter sp.]|nr:WbqC family protein [Usitatibacter sp.]